MKEHDATPYRDVILHACLNNTTYDPQVEDFKTDYMMEVIKLTGEFEFYRRRILDATTQINDETDDWTANFLVDFTSQIAIQGDAEARQIIYDVYLDNFEDEDTLGTSAIIEIDKANGLVFIIDQLAKKAQELDPSSYDYLLWLLEDEIGEEEADLALSELRDRNFKLDSILNLVEYYRLEISQESAQPPDADSLTYEEIKTAINNSKGINIFRLRNWMQNANSEILQVVANDLLRQDDPQQLLKYLRLFLYRPYPLDAEDLFMFVGTHNRYVTATTLSVLKEIENHKVREFALRHIVDKQFIGRAVGLLTHNFQDDDWTLIERISEQRLDKEDYHDLEWSVQDVFKENPDPTAAQTLLNIYEYGPCTTCRRRILLMLKSIDAITPKIQEECLYDASEDIRNLAQNNFIETD